VAACLAALSLTAVASAGASVTIGQLAPVNSPIACSLNTDRLSPTVTSGNSFVVPGTGTITSWSHNATMGANQQLTMKLFRKVGDPATYTALAHDTRALTASTLNTFPTSIPVRPGDVLGSNSLSTGATACTVAVANEPYLIRNPGLADGESQPFTPITGSRLNISAVFEPTNTFTLGGTTRNKKKGTATITADLPNAGELTASGNGVKAASAGQAVISKSVTVGQAQLLIKAKGKKNKTLNETGKVKLKVAITYTPTGGDPSTQSTKLKLRKR
jgi:hypothetical protein